MNKIYDEYNLYNYQLSKGCHDGTIDDMEKEYKDTMDNINQLQKEGINTFVDLLHLNFLTIKAIELDRKIGLMKRNVKEVIAMTNKLDFCTNCRKYTSYRIEKANINKNIHGKDYTFTITIAICNECGEETTPHGLIDKNIKEVEEQYKELNKNK